MAEYLKKDSEKGYVLDNAEIAYSRFNNMRHAILGCMLGDFDQSGKYFISDEIKQELITMSKYIVDSVENIDICHSILKLDKQISFFVTFESDRATLTLVEKVNFQANNKLNSGIYSNVIETIIDSVETSGTVNRNAIYRRWNISSFMGDALDIFHLDEDTIAELFGIVNKFKYLMAANELLLRNEAKIEEVESEYATEILSMLAHYPKLKKVVEEELKQTLTEQSDFIKLDKPNVAKTINEIINQAIENNIEVLTEKEQEEFAKEKHEITNNYNIKIEETVPIRVEKSPTEEIGQDNQYPLLDTKKEEANASVEDLARAYVKRLQETNKRNEDEIVSALTGEQVEPSVEPVEDLDEALNKIFGANDTNTNKPAQTGKKDLEKPKTQESTADGATTDEVKKPTDQPSVTMGKKKTDLVNALKGIVGAAVVAKLVEPKTTMIITKIVAKTTIVKSDEPVAKVGDTLAPEPTKTITKPAASPSKSAAKATKAASSASKKPAAKSSSPASKKVVNKKSNNKSGTLTGRSVRTSSSGRTGSLVRAAAYGKLTDSATTGTSHKPDDKAATHKETEVVNRGLLASLNKGKESQVNGVLNKGDGIHSESSDELNTTGENVSKEEINKDIEKVTGGSFVDHATGGEGVNFRY